MRWAERTSGIDGVREREGRRRRAVRHRRRGVAGRRLRVHAHRRHLPVGGRHHRVGGRRRGAVRMGRRVDLAGGVRTAEHGLRDRRVAAGRRLRGLRMGGLHGRRIGSLLGVRVRRLGVARRLRRRGSEEDRPLGRDRRLGGVLGERGRAVDEGRRGRARVRPGLRGVLAAERQHAGRVGRGVLDDRERGPNEVGDARRDRHGGAASCLGAAGAAAHERGRSYRVGGGSGGRTGRALLRSGRDARRAGRRGGRGGARAAHRRRWNRRGSAGGGPGTVRRSVGPGDERGARDRPACRERGRDAARLLRLTLDRLVRARGRDRGGAFPRGLELEGLARLGHERDVVVVFLATLGLPPRAGALGGGLRRGRSGAFALSGRGTLSGGRRRRSEGARGRADLDRRTRLPASSRAWSLGAVLRGAWHAALEELRRRGAARVGRGAGGDRAGDDLVRRDERRRLHRGPGTGGR